jgi:hypothetical protein
VKPKVLILLPEVATPLLGIQELVRVLDDPMAASGWRH